MNFHKNAFTLAEVLITLGIIGVVASILIPNLMKQTQEHEFKIAYKKAYSEASNIWQSMRSNNEIEVCNGNYDDACADKNFAAFKSYMKVTKSCGTEASVVSVNECWLNSGESFAEVALGDASAVPRKTYGSGAIGFVDVSGRSWVMIQGAYYWADQLLVDTNGFKNPNLFGRDRFVFWLSNSKNLINSTGVYSYLYPSPDRKTIEVDCGYPPCNGTSWLYK